MVRLAGIEPAAHGLGIYKKENWGKLKKVERACKGLKWSVK